MLAKAVFVSVSLFAFIIASAQTTVTGTVTGVGGVKLKRANVFLIEPGTYKPMKSAEVGRDGRFFVEVDTPGLWLLQFTGAEHEEHTLALFVERPERINVDIQLGSYNYLPELGHVKVVGNFNRWYVLSGVSMQMQADSSYSAEVEFEGDTVAYKLMGVRDGGEIEGTQADDYQYDGSGGYNSLLRVRGGKAEIEFDPMRLPRGTAKITFPGASSIVSEFAANYDSLQGYRDSYMVAYRAAVRSGKIREGFKYDWRPAEASLQNKILTEGNPLLRGELIVSYLSVCMISGNLDQSVARTALKDVSPSSPLWSLTPHVAFFALTHSGISRQQQADLADTILAENGVANMKADLLFDEYMASKLSGDLEKAGDYYDILVEQYGFTDTGKMTKAKFQNTRVLKIGKRIPSYSVASVDDSTKTMTDESLEGKSYLIFFWSSASDSCLREIGVLQKVFAKYKGRDFTILSLSADSSRQTVVRFIGEKSRMPWLNAYIGNYSPNKVLLDFQVSKLPQLLLVGPDRKLLASGEQLSGDDLEKTLASFLKR
jgi:hypothetical protein